VDFVTKKAVKLNMSKTVLLQKLAHAFPVTITFNP